MTAFTKLRRLVLFMVLALIGSVAAAANVSLIGLADGMAVLIIDNGKPRTLRDGQSAPGGIKLISANPDYALIEVDGQRQKLTLGQAAYAPSAASDQARVILTPDRNGHFISTGTINGTSVQFLVDTGASLIAMGLSDARRAGINYLAGEKAFANTANGVAAVYRVRLDNVRLGDIVMNNVEAMVHPTNELPVVLLGMSFLGRLDMRREGESLTLIWRY